jgi:hypothetical protein
MSECVKLKIIVMKKQYAFCAIILLAAIICSCVSSNELTAENGMKIQRTKAVDLGLKSGTLWASHNLGAKSPEGYGHYLAWGETKPKKRYTWANYSYLKSDPSDKEGHEFHTFSPKGRTILVGDKKADAATALWGEKWCMPTKEQIDELLRDCDWTWTRLRGVNGFVVTGPNGQSIFMPAAGSYFETDTKCFAEGETLYYWCGELCSSEILVDRASCLIYEQDYPKFYDRNGDRCDGKTVRPVMSRATKP